MAVRVVGSARSKESWFPEKKYSLLASTCANPHGPQQPHSLVRRVSVQQVLSLLIVEQLLSSKVVGLQVLGIVRGGGARAGVAAVVRPQVRIEEGEPVCRSVASRRAHGISEEVK